MRIKLKVFRICNNLTQRQVAQILGISPATYNMIEKGSIEGSMEFWVKLAYRFNLTDEQLIEMKEFKK